MIAFILLQLTIPFFMLTLNPVTTEMLPKLLAISRTTFYDTFAIDNTPETMTAYMAKAFSEEQILEELNNTNTQFYFCTIEQEVVGYIKLNFATAQTEWQEDKGMEIERIYVSKEHQGKKIGQFLLDAAINIALQNNMEYVWLGVWIHNPKAIAFYEKNNFEKVGTHSFVMGEEQQEDWLMKKIL